MKSIHWIFFSLVALWLVYHTARLTHVFFPVTMVSISNAPTLEKHSLHFCSKYNKPALFKFLVFKNRQEKDQPTWVFRICGMPGDKVEIKDGILLINDVASDSQLTLSHRYAIRVIDTLNMNIDEYSVIPMDEKDSLSVPVADQWIKENSVPARRYILPPDSVDAAMLKKYGQAWNLDHFGPVTVPENNYFLLGDNRAEAIDSRYLGYIKQEDIVGCLFNAAP